jgi:hypothetical protein
VGPEGVEIYETKTVEIRPNARWLEKRVNDVLFDRTASFEEMVEFSAIKLARRNWISLRGRQHQGSV